MICMQKNNQHVDFPSGHPPEYYPRLSLVNFAERTGCSSFRLIWPIKIFHIHLLYITRISYLRFHIIQSLWSILATSFTTSNIETPKFNKRGYRSPQQLIKSSKISFQLYWAPIYYHFDLSNITKSIASSIWTLELNYDEFVLNYSFNEYSSYLIVNYDEFVSTIISMTTLHRW